METYLHIRIAEAAFLMGSHSEPGIV